MPRLLWGLGEARIDLNRAIAACHRLLVTLEHMERASAAGIGLRKIWIELNGAVATLQCLAVSPERVQRCRDWRKHNT